MTNLAYEMARREIGTWEWEDGHNPKVVQYFADAGHPQVKDDETAWCAAFVGAMLERAGYEGTGKLNARSYLNWGQHVEPEDAQTGDIVVYYRGDPKGWQGHVGFYVREADAKNILTLGGNQANQVNEKPYAKSRLLAVRRPKKQRITPAESTTIQASATQVGAGIVGGVTAVGSLDGTAQIVALVLCAVVIGAAAYIWRERLRKWAAGDR